MTVTYAYYRLTIEIPWQTIPVNEHEPDATDVFRASRCAEVERAGLDVIHEYYWPGDNQYYLLRVRSREQLLVACEFGTVERLDPHHVIHRGRTIEQEFQLKDERTPKLVNES